MLVLILGEGRKKENNIYISFFVVKSIKDQYQEKQQKDLAYYLLTKISCLSISSGRFKTKYFCSDAGEPVNIILNNNL